MSKAVCDLAQFKGKRLLILGGFELMLRIVDIAHANGILVYVTDYDKDSPCKKVADKAFDVNAIDVDAVVDLIKRESIDGMITGYVDMLLPYYAEICRKAGIPSYATLEQVQLICTKDSFNDLCKRFDLPVPKRYSELDAANGNAEYPLAIKPVDNSGSRGLTICYKKEDVPAAINKAKELSKLGRCIVQEYLPDETVLLQYYIQDGKPTLFGLSDQYKVNIYEDKSMIGACEYAPSKYTKQWIENYNDKFISMLKSTGINNGSCEIECWIKNGKIHIGDIGFRMCGGKQEYYYADATGVYLPEMLIELALSGRMADCDISKCADPYMHGKKYGHIKITMKPGTINKIIGFDELRRQERILRADCYFGEGYTVKPEEVGTYKDLVSRIFFKCNEGENFSDVAEEIFDTVDFLDAEGKSLKLPTNVYNEFVFDS